jgi:hypothetical protein
MWDLAEFLMRRRDVPQPFSVALDDGHADHGCILAAFPTNDQDTAPFEMEKHIVAPSTSFAPNADR